MQATLSLSPTLSLSGKGEEEKTSSGLASPNGDSVRAENLLSFSPSEGRRPGRRVLSIACYGEAISFSTGHKSGMYGFGGFAEDFFALWNAVSRVENPVAAGGRAEVELTAMSGISGVFC